MDRDNAIWKQNEESRTQPQRNVGCHKVYQNTMGVPKRNNKVGKIFEKIMAEHCPSSAEKFWLHIQETQ